MKYKNIYWFLIDGLSPQHLNISTGSESIKKNFFDELFSKGTMFSRVYVANGGTHTSMHAIFTSLMPSYNGATGWTYDALRQFDTRFFTITDYMKNAGYATFRYCDTHRSRTVPMSGFDVWESSGYVVGELLKKTDNGDCPRRQRFIDEVNKCSARRFVYHHCLLLHELDSMNPLWHEIYEDNIAIMAEEFQKILSLYDIGEDDLLIISSDHGMTTDKDYIQDGIQNGERHYEEGRMALFTMVGKGIKSQVLDGVISALDISPTLLKIALGIDQEGIQGRDRSEYVFNGRYQFEKCYTEKGTYCNTLMQNPMSSDLFCVRDCRWKYVYGTRDERCEWLIDLENDPDYKINRKDEYPDIAKKYREELFEKLIGVEADAVKFYEEINFAGGQKPELCKPVFSVVAEAGKVNKERLADLLDLGGPYYELLMLNYLPGMYPEKLCKDYRIHLLENEEYEELLTGEWIVTINYFKKPISEYLLSDIYRYLKRKEGNAQGIKNRHFSVRRKDALIPGFRTGSTGIRVYVEKKHHYKAALKRIIKKLLFMQ